MQRSRAAHSQKTDGLATEERDRRKKKRHGSASSSREEVRRTASMRLTAGALLTRFRFSAVPSATEELSPKSDDLSQEKRELIRASQDNELYLRT
jgi:hypothetical protein